MQGHRQAPGPAVVACTPVLAPPTLPSLLLLSVILRSLPASSLSSTFWREGPGPVPTPLLLWCTLHFPTHSQVFRNYLCAVNPHRHLRPFVRELQAHPPSCIPTSPTWRSSRPHMPQSHSSPSPNLASPSVLPLAAKDLITQARPQGVLSKATFSLIPHF